VPGARRFSRAYACARGVALSAAFG